MGSESLKQGLVSMTLTPLIYKLYDKSNHLELVSCPKLPSERFVIQTCKVSFGLFVLQAPRFCAGMAQLRVERPAGIEAIFNPGKTLVGKISAI